MSGPLTGLRVLDLATVIAAPSAAALLGDYGAEVLKVEMPGEGDNARNLPPFKDGKPLWWKVINRNKKCVSLDLRQPEGAELLLRLLPHFDVLIENFRPGTLDRWGLTAEAMWAVRPRLVILRATGFGQSGPYRDRPGYARIFEAMGGLANITGEADGEPMHAGYPIGDGVGGLYGALGILAACWKRARDPEASGEEIDLAMTEATIKLVDNLAIKYDQVGEIQGRIGNANQFAAPSAVLKTRDNRWVSLAGGNNPLFANNCRAIGRPDLIDDPRCNSSAARLQNQKELSGIFRAWCAEHTLEEILSAFQREGGTLSPVYSIDQIFTDPHLQARDAITTVPDTDFGSVRMPNVVPRFKNDPGAIRSTGGAHGQDNAEIYGELLGLSASEQERLRAKGVI